MWYHNAQLDAGADLTVKASNARTAFEVPSLSPSLFHTDTHSLSLSLSLTHTQKNLSLSLSHTHTQTLSLTHTHTHTRGAAEPGVEQREANHEILNP